MVWITYYSGDPNNGHVRYSNGLLWSNSDYQLFLCKMVQASWKFGFQWSGLLENQTKWWPSCFWTIGKPHFKNSSIPMFSVQALIIWGSKLRTGPLFEWSIVIKFWLSIDWNMSHFFFRKVKKWRGYVRIWANSRLARHVQDHRPRLLRNQMGISSR